MVREQVRYKFWRMGDMEHFTESFAIYFAEEEALEERKRRAKRAAKEVA
jgi:hypothetical protein